MINSEFYHKYKWSVCIEYRFADQDMDEDSYFIDEDYPTREELVKGLANLFCKLKEENDNHKNFDDLQLSEQKLNFMVS